MCHSCWICWCFVLWRYLRGSQWITGRCHHRCLYFWICSSCLPSVSRFIFAIFGRRCHDPSRRMASIWCRITHATIYTLNLRCKSYSPNQLLIWLCLAFILITLGVLLVDWSVFDPFIQYVTLFYGTFLGWYGIMDIWDDTISRVVEGSDAYACHQMWVCCLPRCVGIQFALLAICCQVLGVYFALVSLVDENISK